MTRILSFGRWREEEWQRFGDERVEIATAVLADAGTLREQAKALSDRGVRLALDVDGAVPPEDYADLLGVVEMVRIQFGKFTDGRGFSSARELRERFGFAGTVRAAGSFIPDQMSYLARVGFDEWEIDDHPRAAQYQQEVRRFAAAYQRLPGDRRLGLEHRTGTIA